MGFRLRKSFGDKNFRVTVSKSGVSYSAGCKGFRATKKANGGTRTTVSIPDSGLSYVEETNPTKEKTSSRTEIKTQLIIWGIILGLAIIGVIVFFCTYFQTIQHNKWIEEERAKHNYSIDFCFVEMPTMTYEYSASENGYRCVLQGTVKNQSGYYTAGATFIFGFYNDNEQLLDTGNYFVMSFENNTNRNFKIYSKYFKEKPTIARLLNVEYSLSIN